MSESGIRDQEPGDIRQRDSVPGLLVIEPELFRSNFDEAPFVIKHNFSENPLFDVERLLNLARRLPKENVEYNAGNIDISCLPEDTKYTGLTATETIRRIRECNSWMVLKNIELDPQYRNLLLDCLADVAAHSQVIRAGMCKEEGYIFLSSPGAITPYHMDPEHNFLLQIKGQKFMTVFPRSVSSAQELENFYLGAHRNMQMPEGCAEKARTFELLPGDGLHVPATAPHYVRNGNEVSVSFSITFRTPDLERRGLAHNMNGLLRRYGLRPNKVGLYPVLDGLKVASYRLWQKSNSLLGLRG